MRKKNGGRSREGVILGESDHVLLEFLILKKTKAECSCTYTLDFNKLRKMIGKIAWQHILTGKGVQDG